MILPRNTLTQARTIRRFAAFRLPQRGGIKLALAAVIILPSVEAQPEPEEDIFQLPEFVVDASQERGYRATNTLTGTFLDTPLKDSPFAIDVFMPDLIDDTGSTNMREVLAYDSGLQLENTIGSQGPGGEGGYTMGTEFDARGIDNAETDIVTRGFRAPTLKNGFFTQTRVDTINIARVERAGGPQSLLYGIGAISGITNVITKRPLPEPRYRLASFVGNHDFYRGTAEATGPIWSNDNMQLNYNALLALQKEGSIRPHRKDESIFFAPALQFRGWDATTVFLASEIGWRKQHGRGPADIGHPRAGLIDPRSGNPSGLSQTGDPARFLEDYLGLGPYGNIGGPDTYTEDDVTSWHLEITQRVGRNFRILASFNRDEQDREDRNYLLSPRILERRADDGTFIEDVIEYAFGVEDETRRTHQARVAALASFELLGGQHSFVAGRQDFSQRRNFDQPIESSVIEVNELFHLWPADGSSIRYEGEELPLPRARDFMNTWYQGHYLIYQGSLWNNRIHPVLGYRWDRTHTRALRSNLREDGSLGEPFDHIDRNTLDGYANAGKPFNVESPTLGLSVSITDNLSVYGVYAEGIALSNVAQRDGNNEGFPPEFTRNREVGVKFSAWNERISGRVTYFNLQKRGGVRFSFYAPRPAGTSFNPDEPITAALEGRTAANPSDMRYFMSFLGLYDMETPGLSEQERFSVLPGDMPGVELFLQGDRPFFIFPYGELGNPGRYDPATNTAPAGYGQDLLAFIQHARELAAAGTPLPSTSPQFMWAGQGNHPGEDRGAYHTFDEESTGYEVRIQITPIDNWQMILSYTYNTVEITQGLSGLADPEIHTGIEPWWWYLDPNDFGDPTRPSTYQGDLSAGVPNTDVPKHSFTLWTKYEFTEGLLEGFDLRFGARHVSSRAAESPWARTDGRFVNAIHNALGEATKAPVPGHTIYDAGMGYRWTWNNLDWRVNLNVRNVFNKRELTALADTRQVMGEPILTRFFLTPRDVRVSLRVDF